ncbi:acyl-CoA thioesterase [Thalassobaculum sp.]|uniref:acyl-CoA thioesterase n=1 Tax=Thalassobaculum sp. TaxID=2022740 RepID=UPI0032EFF80C
MAPFTKSVPVRFEDCDPAGIGFYPRILMMVNRLIEDFFAEALDHPWPRLHGCEKRAVPTVRLEVDFKGPLRQGDALELELQVLKVGNSAFTVAVAGSVGGAERFAVIQVLAYTTAGPEVAAKPMPDALKAGLARFMVN